MQEPSTSHDSTEAHDIVGPSDGGGTGSNSLGKAVDGFGDAATTPTFAGHGAGHGDGGDHNGACDSVSGEHCFDQFLA